MSDTNKKSPTIFEEWVEVDCNECSRYWDNSCDGCKDTLKGSKKPCNSFLATRSVIIPQKIERLERVILGLKIAIAVVSCVIAGMIAVMMEVL